MQRRLQPSISTRFGPRLRADDQSLGYQPSRHGALIIAILLVADWSKQLFDVAQMHTIRYLRSDGDVGGTAAELPRNAIHAHSPRRQFSTAQAKALGQIIGTSVD